MSRRSETVPQCRGDLVIREVSDDSFVVKDPTKREYFSIGLAERFLLNQFDGQSKFEAVCDAFEREFQDELTDEDIDDFLRIVRSRGLLEESDSSKSTKKKSDAQAAAAKSSTTDEDDDPEGFGINGSGSLLYFRVRLYDPDKCFNFLEPLLRWVWTIEFLIVSGLAMLFALLIIWTHQDQLVASFPAAVRWETIVLVTAVILLATVIHEYAHGLTCKHFGGEVHDVGVLVMFFIPCLYCNVSDAWMIPQKHRRLLITAAGGYADLCLWAMAVFVWRLTVPGCLLNYISFVVLTVCGSRGFLNFNPLLRLDGYYLLSDGLGIPNLRIHGTDRWMATLRWLLWGAERPKPEPNGRILLLYGIMKWFFALGFLDVVLLNMLKYLGSEFGIAGMIFTSMLMMYACKRVFRGFFQSECMTMLKTRHRRTATYAAILVGILLLLFLIPVKHYATGDFEIRPGDVYQVHSPVSGFIQTVFVEEGAHLKKGDPIAQLVAPELEAQLAGKISELDQVNAILMKLRMGPRPEQLLEQRKHVARLEEWFEHGKEELERARISHEQELLILNHRIKEIETELAFSEETILQAEKLYQVGALAGAQLKADRLQIALAKSKASQARATYEAARTQGIHNAKADYARRKRELADAQAELTLLEAGTRPEEISAEEARREGILKELDFLKQQQKRLLVRAPVDGVVSTPRMREKAGSMVTPGLLFCTIEDSAISHIEISISEDNARALKEGLPVSLKVRAIPFETFHSKVERISTMTNKLPTAGSKNHVIVHCHLPNSERHLKSGMTGFGRIERGWKTIGVVLLSRGLRYLRTEFWW